jgi:hypothetical protein
MTIQNPTKAFLALVGLICLTVLLALGSISESTGTGMIGTIVGYVVGNTVGARTKTPIDPSVGPRDGQ